MNDQKTYPLYAIMGGEISDKERIAELEAEVKAWREYAHKIQQLSFLRWKEARDGK